MLPASQFKVIAYKAAFNVLQYLFNFAAKRIRAQNTWPCRATVSDESFSLVVQKATKAAMVILESINSIIHAAAHAIYEL